METLADLDHRTPVDLVPRMLRLEALDRRTRLLLVASGHSTLATQVVALEAALRLDLNHLPRPRLEDLEAVERKALIVEPLHKVLTEPLHKVSMEIRHKDSTEIPRKASVFDPLLRWLSLGANIARLSFWKLWGKQWVQRCIVWIIHSKLRWRIDPKWRLFLSLRWRYFPPPPS